MNMILMKKFKKNIMLLEEENNENKLFSDNLRAKKFTKNKLVLNKYIIFGGILNEVDFMNSLVNSFSK